jgi:hypothetical protein
MKTTFPLNMCDMTHISLMNELHPWYELFTCVTLHTYEYVHMWRICRVAHVWILQVTRMNESFHTYAHEWVMAHISVSHDTHVNASRRMHESFHIYTREWVMAHTWMSHAHMCMITPNIWMSHVRHTNALCHTHTKGSLCYTYEWVMSHTWMRHVTCMNDMSHQHRLLQASKRGEPVENKQQYTHHSEWGSWAST